MKYILFDIDGTLIDSGGAGKKALNQAFEKIFGVQNAFADISMAGKTDLQILREGLTSFGMSASPQAEEEFFGIYIRHLKNNLGESRGYIMPGIREALTRIAGAPGRLIGLLTGNMEAGARLKLDHFGIGSWFSGGAFGDEHEDRNMLLPLALDKLNRRGTHRLGFSDCVVIGDTPRDVHCSKPYGALSIAVATGPYSAAQLAEAGADRVFTDLSDTDALMEALAV